MNRILLAGLLGLTCSAALAKPEAFFSSRRGIQPHIVTAINKTARSLDIAVYELSNKALLDAVKIAAQRGVEIRVLLDESVLRKHPESRELAALMHISLRALPGRVKPRGLMHNKFAIFDERSVVTGSYNWTRGAEFANYENALFEDDSSVVRSYSAQFSDLWVRGHPVEPAEFSSKRPQARRRRRTK